MTDPSSYDPHTNANQQVPETVQAEGVSHSIAQPADSESAHGRAASAVVARGTLLLSLLSRQAAAARAEAQCAELRILLGEARAGESARLRRWLRIHAAEYPTECSPADPSADGHPVSEDILRLDMPSALDAGRGPHVNADSAKMSAVDEPSDGLNDWQSLLAPARARLHEQAQQLRASHATPAGPQLLRAGETSQRNAGKPAVAECDVAQVAKTFAGSQSSSKTLGSSRERKTEWRCEGKIESNTAAKSKSEIEGKAKRKREREIEGKSGGGPSGYVRDKPLQHQRQMRVWRVRGALASMVAHGVLLMLLAWMTLRLPPPPAGLELQSTVVESLPQTLEVSQPIELSSPEQPTESSAALEAFDASQSLSQVTADVGSTLAELSAPLASGLPSQSLLSAHAGTLGRLQSNTVFFGAAASGNCFCYIIDGSGSMRNGPWEAARFELLKSLASLTEKQRFYIIFFNRQLNAIPLPGEQTPAPAALYATRENLTHTRRWLDTLRIGIGGPPNDALAMAIDKQPDAIYLLTDGVTSVDVATFLRERNRISDLISGEQVRVPIHTIAFYSLDGQALLKQLAAENAGQFTYVPDPR